MRKKELQRVFDTAMFIVARGCDIFVPPYTCISEDDGKLELCDPCSLVVAGVPMCGQYTKNVMQTVGYTGESG